MPNSIIDPVLRVVALPQDANARGDMFGGWIMGQMDIAGSIPIFKAYNNQIATRAVNNMQFLKPILVNAYVSITAEITDIGPTHATSAVTVYAQYSDQLAQGWQKVATADITYVAISKFGRATRLKQRG